MSDLRKIFDLRKFFAVPKNFLKSKIHCIQIKVCLTQSLVFSKQNVGQGHENCIYATVLAAITDYGHTMAKSLVFCGPDSNPNPKKKFGIWI